MSIVEELRAAKAEFSQSRNDMYWKHFDLEDGLIRWTGYDDDYWWRNKSVSPTWQTRTGKSGRRYTLDPVTGDVFIDRAIAAAESPPPVGEG